VDFLRGDEALELRHHSRLAIACFARRRGCAVGAGGRSGKRAHRQGAQETESDKHDFSPPGDVIVARETTPTGRSLQVDSKKAVP
jgi:hypothetical protein